MRKRSLRDLVCVGVGAWVLAVLMWVATTRGQTSEAETTTPVGVIAASISTDLDAALARPVPENIAELKLIEDQVRSLVPGAAAATVSVRIGEAWGSGVIVDPDGLVLTAAHVSGEPGARVEFFFADGKRAAGVSLGRNLRIDAGMMKITDPGPWPCRPTAPTGQLKPGAWCIAIGHPGGFDIKRPYVVRLGRIIRANVNVVQSDCTLVGGDSGGPLFDMHGRIIGIHSRISGSTAANFHVPIDTYRETWDRLAKSDDWGGQLGGQTRSQGAYLGVRGASHADGVVVTGVYHNSPARKAGLKPGDVIVKFNQESFNGWNQFARLIAPQKPGAEVILEVRREQSQFSLKVTLADGRPQQ